MPATMVTNCMEMNTSPVTTEYGKERYQSVNVSENKKALYIEPNHGWRGGAYSTIVSTN